jgi:hypothetical protein
MNDKKKHGKFYTKNYSEILQDLEIPDDIKIIVEPFVGQGDLLSYINKQDLKCNIETYDICKPKNDITANNITFTLRDTLNNPPKYKNKAIITNPPYLARNKSNDKKIYDKYKTNDLFKCFLLTLIEDPCDFGIIILPLNFFCNLRKSDIELRDKFFKTFDILTLNIFKKQVFKDTSYQICSFSFCLNINKKKSDININKIIFRSNKDKILNNIKVSKFDKWLIGGEIYSLELNKEIKIYRYLERDKKKTTVNTHFYIETIDSKENIKLTINKEIFYGKNTSRTTASINTNIKIELKDQKEICEIFNNLLNLYRDKYDSLFLINYRDNNRKRISFRLVYELLNYSIMKFVKDNDILIV